jgi:hypothetical protein
MIDTDDVIKTWMIDHLEEYRDDCLEINATGLAEGCCEALGGYDARDDIPEIFFEIAGWLAIEDEEVTS